MSLFGFGDITFNKEDSRQFGPLAALEGSVFSSSTFRFPSDLGTTDKGHYMVFYCKQQSETRHTGSKANYIPDSSLSSAQRGLNKVGSEISEITSKIPKSGISAVDNLVNGLNNSIQSKINSIGDKANIFGSTSFFKGSKTTTDKILNTSVQRISDKGLTFANDKRKTSLTSDAIGLYMPDTLFFSQQQSYDQLAPGKELAGQLLSAGVSATDAYRKSGNKDVAVQTAIQSGAGQALAQSALNQVASQVGLSSVSNTSRLAILATTGKVINPMLEMIYSSPNFRTFQFDFAFYPRDEKEALEVQRILERFRFHQAPEVTDEAGRSGLLVPPSEFEIRFYYNGAENPNIPAIGNCVLNTIDINYAPNGFSAYEVPGENNPALGRTGMPSAINLTLQFQETEYLTKQDFNKDVHRGGR